MAVNLDEDAFEELRELLGNEPIIDGPPKEERTWAPELNHSQQECFDSTARFLLLWGDRGGGKTYGAGHKIVRHLYEYQNAFALILVGVKSQATAGGIWEKLELEILPDWGKNLGLEYQEAKMDEMRYRYRMVKNAWGGWSKLLLISAPHEALLKTRIRGFEPSLIFVDEGTTLGGPGYFTAVTQQLGRRPGVPLQQYIMATNPDGPSHWVYKRFFEIPLQESKNRDGEVISPAGEWDKRYQTIEMTSRDNKYLNETYYESVMEATRNDPIEIARMVEGKWVDRPTGDGIFGNSFFPEIHIVGDAKKRVLPSKNFPIIFGYDLGSANNAIIWMQLIPTTDNGAVWVIFDEMVYNDKNLKTRVLVREQLRRWMFWNRNRGVEYKTESISDDSAFNQFRAAGGSYDVLDYERESKELIETSFKDKGLHPIKMKAAPKFAGSIEARVRIMNNLLHNEKIIISSSCVRVKQMFMNLQCENVKDGKYDPSAAFKPKRSRYVHTFDALTYPMIYHELTGNIVKGSQEVKSELLDIGLGHR
jgi:PBSX family phage terminase large subunit